ncbi:hypothetical protein TCAL_10359 [Tigriopus californicus]|uniref:small monomeric GTPase n=1 Tax=Tigriopus californicus TaxID=6832 RepID=A0A553PG79_TIGCA|nr:hypothetical protein TCAL_10359 [Tigriopus californicus]
MEVKYLPPQRLAVSPSPLANQPGPSSLSNPKAPKASSTGVGGATRKHGTCSAQRAHTFRVASPTKSNSFEHSPRVAKKRSEKTSHVTSETRSSSPHPLNGRQSLTHKSSAPQLESHKFLKTIKAPSVDQGGKTMGTKAGGAVPTLSEVLVRLIIIGAKQVGKSALTVRYLTKRFIGEYRSHAEIIDVSDQPNAPWNLPINRIRSSDAAIVVYSITDRNSFHIAREALDVLATLTPPVEIPVLLMANKIDLNHLRKVSISEGRELSRQYNTAFHEVSVADDPVDTITVMNRVIRELWIAKMEAHRNLFLLSPPFMHMFQSRLAVPPNSVSSDQRCPRSKSSDSSPTNSPPRKTTTATCSTQEHAAPCPTPSTTEVERDRSRKHTVFSMGRVFSHLMGRGSLPPDLPSSSSGSTVTVKERGMSTDRLSLKKVFKKRSV